MRYRAFDLTDVPEGDRLNALQAQLVAWEPLQEAEYLVSWQGAVAQAFAIEKSRLEQDAVKNAAWLPDSLAREPLPEGVRLLQGLDGFEAQAWKAGALRASRWWANRPHAGEWSLFLRQAGWNSTAEQMPEPETAPWKKPAKMPTVATQLASVAQGSEQLLVGLLALVMIGFAAMSARTLWDSYEARRQSQVALEELKAEVAPVIAARDKALAAADRGAMLVSQLRAPRPLEVLEELVRLLPKTGLIREVDVQGMEVRVLLDLPAELSRSKAIADLEAGGWFTQVAESRDGQPRGGVALQMKLSGVVPPQRTNSDVGLQRMTAEGASLPAGAGAPQPGTRP